MPTFRSKIWRQAGELGWVLAAKAALLGANAGLLLVLVRWLSVEDYGLLVVLIGAQTFLGRAIVLGADGGMIRLRKLPELSERQAEVVGAGLRVIEFAILALALLAVIAVAADPGVWPVWAVPVTAAGAMGMALIDYSYAFRLSELDYRAAAWVQGGSAVLRAVATLSAAFWVAATALPVFLVYASAGLSVGIVQWRWLMVNAVRPAKSSLVSRLAGYSVWQGGSDLAVILSLYLGSFILGALGQLRAAGVFGFALTLSMGFFALNVALSQYLFPRMVRLESPAHFGPFLRHGLLAAAALAVACAPAAMVIAYLAPYIAGPQYERAIPAFYWLAASMAISVMQAPLVAAGFYLMRPDLVCFSLVVRAVAIGAFGFLLAPSRGAAGAAIGQFAGSALGAALLAAAVAASFRTWHSRSVATPAPEPVNHG